MHELGIVFHIIRTVEQAGQAQNVQRVSAVTLQLGEVSGVVEEYLQDCWKWAAAHSDMLTGAELRVETIPARTLCESCGHIYPTLPHGRSCPVCRSEHTHLIQGDEMVIRDIHVPDNTEPLPD